MSSTSQKKKKLNNKHFLITAGPTHEKIDPVRFIGNHSSGKMGYALAESIATMGGNVTLVSGPTNQKAQNKNIKTVQVNSAQEMYFESLKYFKIADVGIMAAAVADYTPIVVAENKIKKQSNALSIELKKTKDIAKELGQIKTKQQLLIGFALETENETQHAEQKLLKKNLDFIVLNSLNDKGAGFGTDTNKITLITRKGEKIPFNLKSKAEVANDIVTHIITLL